MPFVLVTGGAGYIGSHTVTQLLNDNYKVIVLDNFTNSSETSLKRVVDITNKQPIIIKGDVTDINILNSIFKNYNVDSVVHFAGLKSVKESSVSPNLYYKNNIYGSVCLLESMVNFSINNLIFSSSATVYGEEANIPYIETMKLGTPSSPYGFSKLVVEKIISDTVEANDNLQAINLRYFNPIGAHKSGKIGEDPSGTPNNLLPYISQVAIKKIERLNIYGNDYPTHDGTCRRDYLHVMDLADGHIAALKFIQSKKDVGVEAFNLGTGNAYSVLEIVNKFKSVTGIDIPFKFSARRDGDLSEFWADSKKAKEVLGWSCKRSLDEMIEDTWRWQLKNPNGFKKND